MRLLRALLCALACSAGARLLADNNPLPSQPANSVNPPYGGAAINQPFPDSIYGADHGASSIALSYPYLSPFGYTDHAHGVITYNVAPFTPRKSEGVYGMDVWLEQQDSSGNWNVATMDGGVADQGIVYQPVNTPNPGPSPSYTFTWTYHNAPLPPYTNFRVFIYVYLYNQGGGSQGNFYVASAIGPVNPGAANDAPRISWTASSGAINPTQVVAGQTYTISADGQDDNGNLTGVSISRNGQPFADAGGGNGYSGNSQNPSSDPPGTVTYTAWATDSYGAQSPTITWTVNDVTPQPPVGSFDGVSPNSLAQGQTLSGSGWAADPQMGAPVSSVQILVDNGAGGTFAAGLGGYRPDVEQANLDGGHWSALDITNSGWSFSYPTNGLSLGAHTLTATAYDDIGLSSVVGTQIFTVVAPQYTVSTFAVGNGSVTPGGTYPENTSISLTASPGPGAWFTGWTGSFSSSSNPLAVTVNGNLTLTANFAALLAQTIVFSPPASVLLPGPPLTLSASASSGLPVSFTLVSGPATLAGNQLTITGAGSIVVQAAQGGNGEWLAAGPVSEVIAANAPPTILRIRFNVTGSDAVVTGHESPTGASFIWTDPTGLQDSPWPSFASPQPSVPSTGSFPLPPIPAAPVLQH